MLHAHDFPGGPTLGTLQYVNIFLVPGSPKLDPNGTPDAISQMPDRKEKTLNSACCLHASTFPNVAQNASRPQATFAREEQCSHGDLQIVYPEAPL